MDWKDFIVQFEQVAEWNRWSYGEMAQQLVMCLRGTAQKLLGDLPHSTLTDYASLKIALGNRFHPQERESAYHCEFRTRRRQKDESSTDFGHALRRLGCLAFPNIPSQWREPFVVDQFISGLGNYEIRKHVAFHHPKTLEAAIALAVEFEAFEGCQGIRKPHVTFEEPRPLVDHVDSVARSEKSEIEHLTRSLNECMQKLDKKSAGIVTRISEAVVVVGEVTLHVKVDIATFVRLKIIIPISVRTKVKDRLTMSVMRSQRNQRMVLETRKGCSYGRKFSLKFFRI